MTELMNLHTMQHIIKNLIIGLASVVLIVGCGKRDGQISNKEQKNSVFSWSSKDGVKDKQYDLNNLDVKSISIGGNRISISGDFGKKISFGNKSIENDRVNFIAAYPNANDPEFILVESGSNGTCCPWSQFYLLMKNKGNAKLVEIPTNSMSELTVTNSNADGYEFTAKYTTGEEASGDAKYGYMTFKASDEVFLKKGLHSDYPGIANLIYGSELFANKDLRSKIFKLDDVEIGELRTQIQMERPVLWQDGSALLLCGVPEKGEWDKSQIIAIDLENKSYEIQRFSNGKLNFIKKVGEIRSLIRQGFSYNGECFQTKFQNVGVGK